MPTFEVNTYKTILVATCELDTSNIDSCQNQLRNLLERAGHAADKNEIVICSDDYNGVTAIMACRKETLNNAPTVCKYSTPLLDNSHNSGCNIYFRVVKGVGYVRVFDNSLLLAETFHAETNEDILYYATRLMEIYNLTGRATIYVKGCDSATKLLRCYFKSVICE